MVPRRVLAVFPLLLFLIVGCSDRDGSDAASDAIAALTTEDLDVLVLPAEELGDLGAGLEIDADSGFVDNAERAEDSFNPDDTEADLEALGRLGGYSVSYSNPSMGMDGDNPLVMITSSVTLYEGPEEASEGIAAEVRDFVEAEGEEVDGATLEDVQEWDPNDLGDERRGVRFIVDVPLFDALYATGAYVRIDRLTYVAAIISLEDADHRETVNELASSHERWIRGVLAGEIETTPQPIPGEGSPGEGDGDGAGPDQGDAPDAADLAAVALQLDDLPDGFVVTEEGLNPDGSGELDFSRTFEPEQLSAPLGSTQVINVESNIMVFASESEASLFANTIQTVLAGEEGKAFFQSALEEEGLQGAEIDTEMLDLNVGDDAGVVLATAGTQLVDFSMAFMVAREGRAVNALIVVSDAASFELADVVPYLELVHERVVSSGIGES